MNSNTPLPNPVSPAPRSFWAKLLETRKRLKGLHGWSPVTGALKDHETGKPFVSIMVITYNHERYIRQAIDSILMQERDFPIEINVIDDASTDGTQTIVREYAQRLPGVVNCYFNQTNAGAIATQLNTFRGFQTLRGRYFALLEGDDYWTDPRKLAKQIDFLEEHPDFVACAHPVLKMFEEGNRAPEHFLPDIFQVGKVTELSNLIKMESVFHLSSIVYRNVFGQTPPICLCDEFSHEATVNMLYGMYGKFYCMNEYQSMYRVHSSGCYSSRTLEQIWCLHLHGTRRMAFYLGGHSAFIFFRTIRKLTRYVLKEGGKLTSLSINTRIVMKLHHIVSGFIGIFGRAGFLKYKDSNSMRKVHFRNSILKELIASSTNFHENNWDSAERGPEPEASPPKRYKAYIRWLLPSLRFRRRIKKFKGIGYLFERLEDFQSRDLLVKLLAFRVMGHRKVKLPQNNPVYWNNIQIIENLKFVGPPIAVDFMNLTLQQRDLRPLGFDMSAYCTAAGGSYIFLQKQYALQREDVICKAELGEIVIDAGACWGETSLYFASEVGESGRVISYEFIPSNIAVLERNIAANPHLGERITIVPNPVWDTSGQNLYYVDWGPGSRVSFQKLRADFDDTQCKTTTIDDTVIQLSLPRVDFIKMDIEGAELNALKGAEKTLRQFHPKLAISLYHSLEDFKTIPRYLDDIGLRYRFYLEHHTIYENETVLFAVPLK